MNGKSQRSARLLWIVLVLGTTIVLGATTLLISTNVRPPASPLASLHTITDIPLAGGSSRLDYQSLDPRTKLLFIAHLGAGIVSVLDLKSSRIVANMTDIAAVHGLLAVPELGRVYASATGSNQIAVIDEQTLRVIARIPAGGYPDGMAYDPLDQKLFVSDETGQTEAVINTQTNQQIATIPLGGDVGNTQYDSISHRIFVDVQTKNLLVAIDPVANRVVASYALPGCQNDHSLLIDAEQHLAFVACDGNNRLLVLDMPSMKVLSTQSVGQAPDVLALDTTWHILYVASESGVVSVFHEQRPTLQKLQEGFVASEAYTIAVDEETHLLYLPLEDVGGHPVLRIAQLRLPGVIAAHLLSQGMSS